MIVMLARLIGIAAACLMVFISNAEEVVTLKAAVAALTDDEKLRRRFEDDLVVAGRTLGYDAVTSYDIVPDVHGLDQEQFLTKLKADGIQIVLMIRPAAVGPGSSLDAVRDEVPTKLFANMRQFAQSVSRAGPDDLIAVVHLGIYALRAGQPELISAGAVWLDEPVKNRDQGIERLEGLIATNVDNVRPAIREKLGLPPLR
jgi:hypothetical protein